MEAIQNTSRIVMSILDGSQNTEMKLMGYKTLKRSCCVAEMKREWEALLRDEQERATQQQQHKEGLQEQNNNNNNSSSSKLFEYAFFFFYCIERKQVNSVKLWR